MRRLSCILAASLGALALSAHAQTWSDQVPQGRVVPLKESVESQMAESRWRLGPFRVDPAVKATNLGYNDNVFGTETDKVDDYTATIGLGVRTIAPIGSKTFVRVDAVPEYTWYYELSERRRFGWALSGDFLALFNRMQIEAGVATADTVTGVNSEELAPVPQRAERYHANVEIELLGRLSMFLGADQQTTSYDPEPEDDTASVTLLDRDESAERVGLRYRFRPDISIFGMVEQTRADFPNDGTYSSNEGDGYLVGASYDRERFYLNLVAGRRSIQYDGPGNPEFDDTTGSAFLSLRVFRRSTIQLNWSRRPVYSTFVDNPFFTEDRLGVGLDLPLGHRIILLGGIESGTNDYETPVDSGDGPSVQRVDDVDSWRAGIGFRVSSRAVLQVEYRTDEYASTIPGFDRKVARLQANLVFR